MHRTFVAAALALVAGCDGCGQAGLEVQGETPYVRCLAAAAPEDADWQVGAVRLRRSGRVLTLEGLPRPARIAAFAGPGPGPAPGAAEVDALRAQRPHLVLLLGDLGDADDTARQTLAALAQLPVPILVLAGGRERADRIESAVSGLKSGSERITDVTALAAVRIGDDTFVPVAGAHEGRYALEDRACGYAGSDLDQLAGELDGAPGGRRWLLAWEAPPLRARPGAAHGSEPLAEFAAGIGARGGLFAWPHDDALQPGATAGQPAGEVEQPGSELRLVVPRVGGPALERADGSRVPPGFALLELDARGLRLVSAHAAP